MAQILKERRGQEVQILHDNTIKTVGEWAEHYAIPKVTLWKWIRTHGVDYAFSRAPLWGKQRVEQLKNHKAAKWDTALPTYDPDHEHKNRLKSWSRRFSAEEIKVKAKMMRLV